MGPTTLTCSLANVRKKLKAKSTRSLNSRPLSANEIVALEAKLETLKGEQRKRAEERRIQTINLCTANESSRVIDAVQELTQQRLAQGSSSGAQASVLIEPQGPPAPLGTSVRQELVVR